MDHIQNVLALQLVKHWEWLALSLLLPQPPGSHQAGRQLKLIQIFL